MRGAILYEVDSKEEVAVAREWFQRWIKHVTAMRSEGCGCCVNVFVFEASEEAIEAIPSPIRKRVTPEDLVAPLDGKVVSPYRLKAKERRATKNVKRRQGQP